MNETKTRRTQYETSSKFTDNGEALTEHRTVFAYSAEEARQIAREEFLTDHGFDAELVQVHIPVLFL